MLSAYESRILTPMLEASPASLGRRLKCSTAQARALQHYLVLVFTAAYRRVHGGDVLSVSMRAHAMLRRVPPHIRAIVQDALGTSDIVDKKSGMPLQASAAP